MGDDLERVLHAFSNFQDCIILTLSNQYDRLEMLCGVDWWGVLSGKGAFDCMGFYLV